MTGRRKRLASCVLALSLCLPIYGSQSPDKKPPAPEFINIKRIFSLLFVGAWLVQAISEGNALDSTNVQDNPPNDGNCQSTNIDFEFPPLCNLNAAPRGGIFQSPVCPRLECTIAGQMTFSLLVEWSGIRDCCKRCSCTGDPHCTSFDGTDRSLRFCDPRERRIDEEGKRCPETQVQCEQKSVLKKKCVWRGKKTKKRNSCTFGGPYPIISMHKLTVGDIDLGMALGESGSILKMSIKAGNFIASLDATEALLKENPWKYQGTNTGRLKIAQAPNTIPKQKQFNITDTTTGLQVVVHANPWEALNIFLADNPERNPNSLGFCGTNDLGGADYKAIVDDSTDMAKFCHDRDTEPGIPAGPNGNITENPPVQVNPGMDPDLLWKNKFTPQDIPIEKLPKTLGKCEPGYVIEELNQQTGVWEPLLALPLAVNPQGSVKTEGNFVGAATRILRIVENKIELSGCDSNLLCQSRAGLKVTFVYDNDKDEQGNLLDVCLSNDADWEAFKDRICSSNK